MPVTGELISRPISSAKGAAAPVLRGFLNSAKGATARPEAAKESADRWRGAPDSAPVLRGLLSSSYTEEED
jgi:hypothetical protein